MNLYVKRNKFTVKDIKDFKGGLKRLWRREVEAKAIIFPNKESDSNLYMMVFCSEEEVKALRGFELISKYAKVSFESAGSAFSALCGFQGTGIEAFAAEADLYVIYDSNIENWVEKVSGLRKLNGLKDLSYTGF